VENEAGHGAGFPPFSQIDTFVSQIFWLAVTFAVLYFASSRWLLPRIRKAIEDRSGAIARDVSAAATASRDADAAVRELEAGMSAARARARDTAGQAKAEADARIAAETAKQEATLERKLSDAEKRIGEVRAGAMANVSAVAESAASAIAEKRTGLKVAPEAARKAVAATMGGT
jgi:F-type H+-transporting ATPase subunit b